MYNAHNQNYFGGKYKENFLENRKTQISSNN